ncbi:MAG: DUF4397 domain-containing protein [Pseudomonadota bacterium]
MTLRILLFALAALLVGCENELDTSPVPEAALVRGLHAMTDVDRVTFLVEEAGADPAEIARLSFQSATGLAGFDEEPFTFSFELTPDDDDDDAVLLIAADATLEDETLYDFVLAGSFAAPELLVWSQPQRDWEQELDDADEEDLEITELDVSFGHAARGEGAVDLYLEVPGTSPSFATPQGTLAFGELLLVGAVEEGTYQIVITPAGDPDTITLATDDIELSAATTTLFALLDEAGASTDSLSLRQLGSGGATTWRDVDATAALSVLHAASGTEGVDVYEVQDFDAPLFGDIRFGEVSDEINTEPGELDLAITPAGEVGVFLDQETLQLAAGAFRRLFLFGSPGDLQTESLSYDQRSFVMEGRVRVFNAAERFERLDVYLVDPTVDIALASPTYPSLRFGSASGLSGMALGEYNLLVTEEDTDNVIAGPVELNVAEGDVVELVLTDATDITEVDVLVLRPD